MRTLRRLLIPAILLTLPACGGDGGDAGEPRAANPPVAVWRPDSARDATTGADAPPTGAGTAAAPAASGTPTDSRATSGNGGASGPGTPPASAPSTATEGAAENVAGPRPSDANSILLRAERAYDAVRTLRADFVQDLTVPLLASTQRSRGEIFHRKPDRFLMRFTDPAGDIVVADGRYLWLYYPSSDPKQVIRTSVGDAGRLDLQREFLSNPTERFTATLDGAESVNGRPARALTLVPKTESPYRRVRIWIDDRDSLARRFEITENNDNVRVVELRDLRVNVDLPDDLFSFTPPAGTQIFDQ